MIPLLALSQVSEYCSDILHYLDLRFALLLRGGGAPRSPFCIDAGHKRDSRFIFPPSLVRFKYIHTGTKVPISTTQVDIRNRECLLQCPLHVDIRLPSIIAY